MFGTVFGNNNSWLSTPPRILLGDVQGEGLFFDFLNQPFIPNQFTFTRGPTNGNAWAVNSSGSYSEYGANVARFNYASVNPYTPRGLWLEGQQTNKVRNPRGAGAILGVVGSGGDLPTNWSIVNSAGLTTEVLSVETTLGFNAVRLRISGTATSTLYILGFETSTGIDALPSEAWSVSYLLLNEGNLGASIGSCRIRLQPRTSAGATVGSVLSGSQLGSIGDLVWMNRGFSDIGSTATIAKVQPQFSTGILTIGLAYDTTILIGWPQCQPSSTVSSPILPAEGVQAESTRSTDLFGVNLSAFSYSGAITIIGSFQLPQNAAASADQMIIQMDDASDSNAVRIRNIAGGATIVMGRVNGGAPTDATALGSMTAGTRFSVGLTTDASGNISASFNGGTVQTLSGAPSGLTNLRIGQNFSGTAALFGFALNLRIIQRTVSSSELQNLTTAALL